MGKIETITKKAKHNFSFKGKSYLAGDIVEILPENMEALKFDVEDVVTERLTPIKQDKNIKKITTKSNK